MGQSKNQGKCTYFVIKATQVWIFMRDLPDWMNKCTDFPVAFHPRPFWVVQRKSSALKDTSVHQYWQRGQQSLLGRLWMWYFYWNPAFFLNDRWHFLPESLNRWSRPENISIINQNFSTLTNQLWYWNMIFQITTFAWLWNCCQMWYPLCVMRNICKAHVPIYLSGLLFFTFTPPPLHTHRKVSPIDEANRWSNLFAFTSVNDDLYAEGYSTVFCTPLRLCFINI